MKGKVIVAFLCGCIALFFAWEASRQVSVEIFKNIDSLSKPIERLHMVNRLFRDINHLEQLQRSQAIAGAGLDTGIIYEESSLLRRSLDTLQQLYIHDRSQLVRIASMKNILIERDSLFSNYRRVREGLVSSKDLTGQLRTLTDLYSKSPVLVEKVITTEKISTVTLNEIPEQEDVVPERQPKTLLGKLFKKKRSVEEPSQPLVVPSEKIPHEELQSETLAVKVDTLVSGRANLDSVKREIDKASESIVSTQRLKSTSFVNREAALMNGGNILINQMLSILQEVERDAVNQVERNSLETRKVVQEGASRIISIVLLFVFATAILLYMILTDIARSSRYRKQLEQAKDEAERHSAVRQRFLANMSHEIRTPLQSIIGFSEQLLKQKNPQREDIEAIHFSSEHLLQIVNEILDYSRLASGKFSLNYTSFDISELLSEIIAVMRPQADKKNLVLILQNHSSFAYLKGDSFRLKQILYNLISNAIKFTDAGSVILKVSAEDVGKRYNFVFTVQDTGTGIPKESLENIFKQFEQVNTSSVAATSGTGLGLSIVKELVELQGGTVEVRSEPGNGSEFIITMPFGKPKTQSNPENRHADLSGNLVTKTIFVVDDDELILQLCSSILQKNGVKHTCFNSPYKLLETMENPEHTIVLADIRMPEMSGLDLCIKLRQKSSEMKIFALTAQALPEERETILESGFDGILMKPFREADLIDLLQGNTPKVIVVPEVEKKLLDLSSIESMTFGDTEKFIGILNKYIDDSIEDIHQLVQLKGTEPEVAFMLHRLAGRSSQLGATKLAALIRELEIIALRRESDERSPELGSGDLVLVAEEIYGIIDLVKDEINRLSDTSPSYSTTFSDQY